MFLKKNKDKQKERLIEYELVELDLQDTIAEIELYDGTEVKRLFKGEVGISLGNKLYVITGLDKAKRWYKEQTDFWEITETKLLQKKEIKSVDLLVSKSIVKIFAEKGIIKQ